MSYYVAKPTSRFKIRSVASHIRNIFGLQDVCFFPIVQLLEYGIHQIDESFSYEICNQEELGNRYGITVPQQSLICIREDVYLGAVEGKPRDRFTIAHEIGHYFLHSPSTVTFARMEGALKVPSYSDPEWQANAFAGELLAPPSIIREMTVDQIVKKCGVSKPVAEIQMKCCG